MLFFSLFWSSIIVMSAAMLQVLTGFGFALVSIPLLLYIYPSYEAVLISMVLSLCTLLLQSKKTKKVARWDLIWRLVAIGFPGLLLGVLISDELNAVYLKGIVGVTVLSYVFIQWKKGRDKKLIIQINSNDNGSSMVNHSITERVSNELKALTTEEKKFSRGFYPAGFLSGILTGAAGLPGPPVTAVLIELLPKDIFRATVVNYFTINYSLALVIALGFSQRQSLTSGLMTTILLLLIPVLIGYFIGHFLRRFVNEDNFKRLVYGLLIIVGITSIGQTFAHIF